MEEPGFFGRDTEAAVQNFCYFEYWLFESVAQNERKKRRKKGGIYFVENFQEFVFLTLFLVLC